MSHTFATMEVPREVFELIQAKLWEAGYSHAILQEGPGVLLDMHGIALAAEPPREQADSDERLGVTVDLWNAMYPVGTTVRYWPVLGSSFYVDTKTRSEAWAIGDGSILVSLEGRSGGVSIEHCLVLLR